MITTAPYAEVTAAEGTWVAWVQLPPTSFAEIRRVLSTLAEQWPVAACCFGGDGVLVTTLLLYRDPSRTHGTPSIAQCDAALDALLDATGWRVDAGHVPITGLLVGLGLREGYGQGATQHWPGEVDQYLEHGTGWRCWTARLVSARHVDGEVRWYDEVGVVVLVPASMLSAVIAAAAACAQHRFAVTDLDARRTYVFAQPSPAR